MKDSPPTHVSVPLALEDIASLGGSDGRPVVTTAIITPIGDRRSPTFAPRPMLDSAAGPELLVRVTELRKLLGPYESQVFAWLSASPDNPKAFVLDPRGSLEAMGITLEPSVEEKLEAVGELINKSVQEAGA